MDTQTIGIKFQALLPVLNERAIRLWSATEAEALGRGGISLISKATGLSRNTIKAGIKEKEEMAKLGADASPRVGRIRVQGAGRKRLDEKNPGLLEALDKLVAPATRGDPESPLLWISKSTEHLAEELTKQGHKVSDTTVGRLLAARGFSLQANRKTKEGSIYEGRDAQFEHINHEVKAFQADDQPAISVDTKKKELVGEYKNGGREWHKKGESDHVLDHDFPDPSVNKAIPYGIFDIAANKGWVNVGNDHDTPAFAVQSIRTWWLKMGADMYPKATKLLVISDCGGSNGYRVRAWKTELQRLANETGLAISVCHFPPGTSKWNHIEHRMFCHISMNWRGRPLVSLEVVVKLIGSTKNKKGLEIKACLDPGKYEIGKKVSDEELAKVRILKNHFQGAWNYSILPQD